MAGQYVYALWSYTSWGILKVLQQGLLLVEDFASDQLFSCECLKTSQVFWVNWLQVQESFSKFFLLGFDP